MSCNDTLSNTCPDPILSTCVDHEGPLGENTKIISDCVNQSDVNTDLYTITDEIISKSDTSDLGSLCITYPLTGSVILQKSVFIQNEIEICSLKNRVTAIEDRDYGDLDITGFDLDFGCLVDPCGDPITTQKQLLQLLISKACE